ncbi:MAG: tyrosine-protein phosphatase [Dehalococcoidia bacterium]|nr:tyrosine-protein phosphatase [Dehalococcoidia bacterium]
MGGPLPQTPGSDAGGTAPERHIRFDRVFNFRDLGGYRARDGRAVRWRTIFRSDSLHEMSDSDRHHFAEQLGVCTVLDLRNPGSVERNPANVRATVHNIAFIDDAALSAYGEQHGSVASTEWYLEVLHGAEQVDGIARAFAVLSEPSSYPLSFNCSLGKDRAGLMAALVLGALGVDHEQIGEDYSLSEQNMGPIRQRYERVRDALGTGPSDHSESSRTFSLADGTFASPPEWMTGVLEALAAEYGSVRGYVEAQGVPGAELDRFAGLLLEQGQPE